MALKIFQQIPDQLKNYAWSVWDGHDHDTIKAAAKEAITQFKNKFGFSPEALWLDKKKKHIWLWHRDLRKVVLAASANEKKKSVPAEPASEQKPQNKKVTRGTVKLRRKRRTTK